VAQSDKPRWQELEIGCIVTDPGSTRYYKTGDWASMVPVTDPERCARCGLCWVFCPDMARIRDQRTGAFDVNEFYCKGCGICARECPTNAITMQEVTD